MKKTLKALALAVLFASFTTLVNGEEAKKVTPETFIRAETDNMYAAMIKNAGGTNKFFHFRNPTPLDKQTVVRMNRDVLYSAGVFDAKDGAIINFPKMPDDRYASVEVIDNDHYVVDIIHEPGVHKVKGETRFLYLIVRIQVKDAFDKDEIRMINELQDKFLVTSETGGEFPGFQWDRASLDAQRAIYEEESRKLSSYAGMMGPRGEVNEETRHIAAASGWGLFPEEEATYLNYKHSSASAGKCYAATYQVPHNKGFWSITVYGDDGHMKSDNNVVNESNVKLNNDGTFTVYFGPESACGKVPNRVDTTDGWNFLLRIYRPGQSGLDGKYTIPDVTEVSKEVGDPSGKISAPPAAQDTKPLWASVPETISPEWGAFLSEKGQGRETPMPAPDDLEGWKAVQAANDEAKEAAADQKAAAFGVTYEESEIAGIPVVEVTPSKLASKDKIAVYTHGGAYVLNSAKAVIESAMFFAAETGLRVIAVDYTLAPHSKWQETTDEVISVFKELAKQGFTADEIVLYGDSAGGGLAAGVTLKMRDIGMEMPAALVLWSPWADISETGDTYVTLRDAEPYYTYEHVLGPSALAYADAEDHKNPYVSPVYGDFKQGFPPTLIQGGTKEIFLSNFIRLYQGLDQSGQTVKLDIYEGMPHVFVPTLPETAESQAAIAKVRDWVSEHLLDN